MTCTSRLRPPRLVHPAWADTQANTGRAWPAGKLSPEGTAKQILFELSQFVLSCKLYVTRHHRANAFDFGAA